MYRWPLGVLILPKRRHGIQIGKDKKKNIQTWTITCPGAHKASISSMYLKKFRQCTIFRGLSRSSLAPSIGINFFDIRQLPKDSIAHHISFILSHIISHVTYDDCQRTPLPTTRISFILSHSISLVTYDDCQRTSFSDSVCCRHKLQVLYSDGSCLPLMLVRAEEQQGEGRSGLAKRCDILTTADPF